MSTITINLGVIDQLYVTPPPTTPPPKGKKKAGDPFKRHRPHKVHEPMYAANGRHTAVTTGQVAEWLEDDYHIMEVFWENSPQVFEGYIANSIAGAINTIINGGPVPQNPIIAAEALIERDMKLFLTNSTVEQMGIPDVPTQAALDGVSHRFKSGFNWIWVVQPNGKKKKVHGVRRPSFIDTGLYRASMKVWS